METLRVPPGHPGCGGKLDLVGRPPGSPSPDELGLVEAVEAPIVVKPQVRAVGPGDGPDEGRPRSRERRTASGTGTRSPYFETGTCDRWTTYATAPRGRVSGAHPQAHPPILGANSSQSDLVYPVSAWGGSLLIAEGGSIALAASESGLFAAGAGAVAIASGAGLVVIGGVAMVTGACAWIHGCAG